MNLPEIKCYQDTAINLVASVINKAQEKLGIRQTLYEIARSRDVVATGKALLSLATLKPPLAFTSEQLIKNAIEKNWRLTETFAYHIKYLGGSSDECSQYYYFEVIFSQPTVAYPIPQATVSVFFRVEDKHTDPPGKQAVPKMVFIIEGHHTDHDVRYAKLCTDWILAALQMKINFFTRIEKIKLF